MRLPDEPAYSRVNTALSTLLVAIHSYAPDGYRDDYGVWHEGPHRLNALRALDDVKAALRAFEAALREIARAPLEAEALAEIARAALAASSAGETPK